MPMTGNKSGSIRFRRKTDDRDRSLMKGRRTHKHLNKDFDQAAMPKTIDLRRNIVVILGGWVLLFYLFVVILQQQVCDTLVIENGETTFTATFEELGSIVPSNTDQSLKELLEENYILITVEIEDGNGTRVGYYDSSKLWIGTDVYASTGAIAPDGDVVELTKDETYTITYWAYLNNTQIESLSFALYRETGQLLQEAFALSLLTILLLVMMWLTEQPDRVWKGVRDGITETARAAKGSEADSVQNAGDRESGSDRIRGAMREAACRAGRLPAVYVVIFMCVAGIFLISSPYLNQTEEERTAFSDAYALSNSILGKEAADENGYVYIEESGIRAMADMEDAQSLHHFWTNWEAGNERESSATSVWYQTSGGIVSPITLLDALAIAAARMLKLPYQMVYLSGKLVNLAIGFGIFIAILFLFPGGRGKHVASDNDAGRVTYSDPSSLFVLGMFLLPSMMRTLLSYQGYGVLAAICILVVLLTVRHAQYRKIVYRIALGIFAVLCAIGLIRTLLARENVVTAAVRTFTANADAWLYGLVFAWPGQIEGAEFLYLCLLGLMLLLLLMARHTGRGAVALKGLRSAEGMRCLWEILLLLIVFLGFRCVA